MDKKWRTFGILIILAGLVSALLVCLASNHAYTRMHGMHRGKQAVTLKRDDLMAENCPGGCLARRLRSCSTCSHSLKTLESLRKSIRLIYNRVPKCGSRTVLRTFKILASRRNWTFLLSKKPREGRNYFARKQVDSFIRNFTAIPPPFVYAQHLHFVEFPDVLELTPWYINVIRDPIERLTSHYYYNMFGSTGDAVETSKTNNVLTLDECVRRMTGPCVGINEILPFFCGHHFKCRRRNEESLAKAKQNADKYFLVIGFTEELPAFMEVLEFLLPRFFQNATRVFSKVSQRSHNSTKTTLKIPPETETVLKLRTILKEEYDFYYFAQKKFNELLTTVRAMKSNGLR